MDIWEWVERRVDELREAGEDRLAYILHALPSAVGDEAHQTVDAMIEEGLLRACELGDPWLEVYLRHWALQSRVLHRNDARRLGEAIEALEFSHRDECRGCPQATCIAQDVASCYGLADGPGYAQERVAVCDQALAKISPAWNCFVCISNEKIDALLDAKEVQAASEFAEAQRRRLDAHGDPERGQQLGFEEILLAQGKYGEALAWGRAAAEEGDDSEFERMRRQMMDGIAYAYLDRGDEARAALPTLAELGERPGHMVRWLRLATLLAERGLLENTAMLRLDLGRAIATLEARHVFRGAFENAEALAFLAVAAKRKGPATRALATMERCAPHLAKPCGAPAALHAVSQLVGGLAWHEVDPHAMVERIRDTVLREHAAVLLEDLESVKARRAEDAGTADAGTELLMLLAAYYRRLGLADEAVRLLQGGYHADPSEDLMYQLGNLWLGEGHIAEVERFVEVLAAQPEPWAKAGRYWFVARLAVHARRYAEALEALRVALPLIEPGFGAKTLAAECERRLGNHEAALALLDAVVAGGAEPGPWDWEAMAVATLMWRWQRVRQSATRLGLEMVLGDTAEHGEGEFCQVVFDDEPYQWDAVRVGPVTARITEIGPLGAPAHLGDVVVFDRLTARHLGDMAVGEAGAPDGTPVFAFTAIAVVAAGRWRRFAIDGVHPGDEAVASITAALQAVGARVEDATAKVAGGRYELETAEGQALPGMYVLVAMPVELDPRRVMDTLVASSEAWVHPVVWLDLSEHLAAEYDQPDQLAAQRAIADRYGISG